MEAPVHALVWIKLFADVHRAKNPYCQLFPAKLSGRRRVISSLRGLSSRCTQPTIKKELEYLKDVHLRQPLFHTNGGEEVKQCTPPEAEEDDFDIPPVSERLLELERILADFYALNAELVPAPSSEGNLMHSSDKSWLGSS